MKKEKEWQKQEMGRELTERKRKELRKGKGKIIKGKEEYGEPRDMGKEKNNAVLNISFSSLQTFVLQMFHLLDISFPTCRSNSCTRGQGVEHLETAEAKIYFSKRFWFGFTFGLDIILAPF